MTESSASARSLPWSLEAGRSQRLGVGRVSPRMRAAASSIASKIFR